MLSKITNLIGWVGVALVFGAFALRFLRPEQYRCGGTSRPPAWSAS